LTVCLPIDPGRSLRCPEKMCHTLARTRACQPDRSRLE
jgi:hypothetical protein